MITDTNKKILGYIRTHKQARVHDLVRTFGITAAAVHRQLNKLQDKGEIQKIGKTPLVFYVPVINKASEVSEDIPKEVKKVIDEHYLYISPLGEMLYGYEGFLRWAKSRPHQQSLLSLIKEYVDTVKQNQLLKTEEGWIDASRKLKDSFDEVSVDKMLYGDSYSLPKFGKTKLGQLLLHAKQSQNAKLIRDIVEIIRPMVNQVIKKFDIEAVAFIPPTIPREIQFMEELEEILNLNIPSVELVKVTGEVAVAQKTLGKLEERVENAKNSIFLKRNKNPYSKILLIDDAAGSGATVNETAKKFRGITEGRCQIIAFAVTGSLKGFDILREV